MIFEAEQINKLRFGMYTEPVKKSCITSIVFKYYGFLYRCEFFVRDPRE